MFPKFSKDFTSEAAKGGSADLHKQSFSELPKETAMNVKTDVRYILSIVVFVIVVVLGGGLWGAKIYFEAQVTAIEDTLIEQDAVIKTNVIADLVSFSQSIDVFKMIGLTRSGYVSLMQEIGKIVVPGVHFSSAKIVLMEDQTYQVDISGVAESLVAYLQQVSVITTSEEDIKFDISGYSIRRGDDGSNPVTFSLKTTVPVDQDTSASTTTES